MLSKSHITMKAKAPQKLNLHGFDIQNLKIMNKGIKLDKIEKDGVKKKLELVKKEHIKIKKRAKSRVRFCLKMCLN
jgi:hypothetical protein